jgi:ABC-type glutathione transport system ATPase component
MKKTLLLDICDLEIFRRNALLLKGSFSLSSGETVALLGENGAGKTTIALSLMGLLNEKIWKTNGQITQKEGGISFVFQDPLRSFNPLKTIGAHFLESIGFSKPVSKNQSLLKAEALLSDVGLTPADRYLNAYPFQLSGGEGQRIAIALALINDPSLLILDEPTSALDKEGCAVIMTLIKKHQSQKGMGVLLISHDGAFIRNYADRVLIIEDQKIKEGKKPSLIVPRQKKLLGSLPSKKTPVLNVSNMQVMRSKKMIFSHVDLSIHSKEIIGLMGDNGSGKTTLARALVGLLPFKGNIFKKNIQMVFQNPLSSFNPKMTLFESLEEGMSLYFPSLTREDKKRKITATLQEMGLNTSYSNQYPETLSGGEIQRAAIARALLLNPDLLILDEPAASLDQKGINSLIALINTLHKNKDMAFLIISHQPAILKALCHKIVELKEGVLSEGSSF